MKGCFTSLCLSLSDSHIIYLSFQKSKSVVCDRGANQDLPDGWQREGTFLVGGLTILKGRWKIPVKGAFRSEGRWKFDLNYQRVIEKRQEKVHEKKSG